MSKIKEIQERLTKNAWEYARIRFLIIKQIFVFVVALYFLSYLFVIGGFYFWPFDIDTLAKINYHLYSLMVVATGFFGYSIWEYALSHRPSVNKALLLIGMVISAIFVGAVLIVHLGIL